jgi:hypothetical protein
VKVHEFQVPRTKLRFILDMLITIGSIWAKHWRQSKALDAYARPCAIAGFRRSPARLRAHCRDCGSLGCGARCLRGNFKREENGE